MNSPMNAILSIQLSIFLLYRKWEEDRFMAPDIEKVTELLRDGKVQLLFKRQAACMFRESLHSWNTASLLGMGDCEALHRWLQRLCSHYKLKKHCSLVKS